MCVFQCCFCKMRKLWGFFQTTIPHHSLLTHLKNIPPQLPIRILNPLRRRRPPRIQHQHISTANLLRHLLHPPRFRYTSTVYLNLTRRVRLTDHCTRLLQHFFAATNKHDAGGAGAADTAWFSALRRVILAKGFEERKVQS